MQGIEAGVASKAYYEAVQADPGASTTDVAVRLGVDASTADYHLRRLARAGLILRERGARSWAHFVAGSVSERERMLGRVSRTARAVYAVLAGSPRPLLAAEVSRQLGVSVGAVRWAIGQLVLLGLARKTARGAVEVVR